MNNPASTQELPWVIFQLLDHKYAINSHMVSSIRIVPDKLTELPESSQYFKGLTYENGTPVPILELRTFFSYESRDQEYTNFENMIDARIEDHKNWVAALEDSLETGSSFMLATDHHKCAFGKWYDNYNTDKMALAFHLKKINDPHRELHESAQKAIQYKNENNEKNLKALLKQLHDSIMPDIISLLSQCKSIYKNSYKNMLIVLENNGMKLGIMVDEIIGVENLFESFSIENMNQIKKSKYLNGVATRKEDSSLVLLLDSENIFSVQKEINVQKKN